MTTPSTYTTNRDATLCAAEVDAAEVDPPWIGLAVVTGIVANTNRLNVH